MTFDEILDQVRELLQQRGRVTYRSLKLRYQIDDEFLAAVTDELVKAERVAADENGEVLVWAGASPGASSEFQVSSPTQPPAPSPQSLAERRQLTVMFIDLVGSTTLSQQLDPEDYHARVVAYQTACHQVVARYDGHVAQYLGDGILVYFGYPTAHEEDAACAVRSGLEIVTAVSQLAYTPRLQIRIGIHTGPVVVGEIGAGERTEKLALGETPNIAARVQGVAEPETVVMSAATYRLVTGMFECRALDPQTLKGIATPLSLYRVIAEGTAQSRFEAAVGAGLTPLVGREEELALLRRRWVQATTGEGQIVLLSGEPGIGKSRLVQELKEHASAESATRIEFRCSAYHQNSALYPIIDHLQRLLKFAREDSPATKLEKLQEALSRYRFPQADTMPLLAALLSLPHPEAHPPITVSPQKQKEKTQAALVAWLVEEAEQNTVYNAWEDLHWADPSTLEVLTLLLDQVPTTPTLAVLTFRPEFIPPWGNRSHLSQLTLSRLGRPHVEAMVEKVTGGKALPSEVVQQIVTKTDGVPLFVEELTKTVLESVESVGATGRSPLQFAIPATLHDSLMARLDRLGTTKEIAQLGAAIGREFSYELLHAVSPVDEKGLHHGLKQLVEAELVYQRGLPPHVTYLFKHALVQDTAYQSLLKSTRQQYHTKIAQVLAEQFPETKESQPELLAHHYTEAGLTAQAIPYWQRAGQKAIERSAHAEAVALLTKGIELLKVSSDISDRLYQELMLQLSLGASFMSTRGYAAPVVEQVYSRARELCQQLGDTLRLFPVLIGLWRFYTSRADHGAAREMSEQLLSVAQRTPEHPTRLLGAYQALGSTLLYTGEFSAARGYLEQGVALYDVRRHRHHAFRSGQDAGVVCLGHLAWALWSLGYPDQAFQKLQAALLLAQELAHPLSLCWVACLASILYQFRHEEQKVQEQAETAMRLSSEHGFAQLLAQGTFWKGWIQAGQARGEEGIVGMQEGLAAHRATGAEVYQPYYLALLSEGYGRFGGVREGLNALVKALAVVDKTGERFYGAELYRLKGQLTLQKFQVSSSKFQVPSSPQPLTSSTQEEVEQEVEGYFLKAIEIARKQQAKSLELRAVMSLVRLRQHQAQNHESRNTQHETRTRLNEAHTMLSEIYNWFTEGFDTKDLQEAKALLDNFTL